MELEVIAGLYRDRTAQVVGGRLIRRQLVQVPHSHITAEIQFSVGAPRYNESPAWIELTENARVAVRGFREPGLVVSGARRGSGRLAWCLPPGWLRWRRGS